MNVETALLTAPQATSRTFARALKTALLQTIAFRKLSMVVLFCFAVAGRVIFAQGAINIDATNFPDADFRQYIINNFDDGDGILAPAEIAAINDITPPSSVGDFTGIEHLTALEKLTCDNNDNITAIDTLPKTLRELYCDGNFFTGSNLVTLPDSLPDSLRIMKVSYCKLTSLPKLPNKLEELWCVSNQLTTLPELPETLQELVCQSNKLTTLPALPESLSSLNCSYCGLTSLPALPASMLLLDCKGNSLTSLDLSSTTVSSFQGHDQRVNLELIWDNSTDGYSTAISLNNPFSGNSPTDELYYDVNISVLTSKNTSLPSAAFSVSTGSGSLSLDGTLYLSYAYIDLSEPTPASSGAGWRYDASADTYTIHPDTNVVVTGTSSDRLIEASSTGSMSGVCQITLRNATLNKITNVPVLKSYDNVSLTAEGVNAVNGINANGWTLRIYGDGILTGGNISSDNLTLDGDVVVFASSVSTTSPPTYTKGILFDGSNKGSVYGATTIPNNVTIPSSDTLNISSGSTLTIPVGHTLVNHGVIIPADGSTSTIGSGVTINGNKINGANVGGTITKNDSTKNTIKINKTISLLANTGQGIEYGIKAVNSTDTTWQATTGAAGGILTFANLTPSTAYKIFARSQAGGYFAAGALSDSVTISTAAVYNVSVGTYTGGIISANPENGLEAGAQVTLTIVPNTGYVLDTLHVIKTLTTDTLTHSGSGQTRTFAMPAHNVTVAAIFQKNANQLAVEAASNAILNHTWSVADTTANSEAELKDWLRDSINSLIAPYDFTVTTSGITLISFTAANSGNAALPTGTDGDFTFTVILAKGSGQELGNLTTTGTAGVIRATPYVGAAAPQITAQPLDTTIVKQDDPIAALSVTTAPLSDNGVLSYQWYRNTTNSTTGGTAITDSVRNEFIPSTAVADTFYYYVVAKNTNNNVTGAQEATDTSDVAVVIVYPRIALPLIASHPQSVNALKGNRIKLSVEATSPDGGALTYQWYRNATNSNSGGTAIADSVRSEFVPSTAAVDTLYYYVTIKNAKSGQDTIVASNVARVIVSDAYKIKIASLENGAITASADSAAATSTITLTIAPSAGYTLDTLYVISGAADTIAHSGSGATRAFAMPADSVTVSALFRKTPPQIDKEAVETAKTAIERGSYHIAQANGNDAASIRTWLVGTIRQFFGVTHDLEVRSATPTHVDVVVTTVTPAIAGTESVTNGVNGSFKFFAVLSRGATTLTTVEVQGVIVATPHSSVPLKRIELSSSDLTLRVANTGNVASGEHTIVLSGADASLFALGDGGEQTIDHDNLAVGADYYLTLVPLDETLAAGTYNLTVTVNAEGLNPSPTISIVYVKTPTGIEGLPEASPLKVRVGNGRLYVKGLTQGQPWSVYSISGSLVYRNTATSDEAEIVLPTKGVYVVVSGAKSVKTVY